MARISNNDKALWTEMIEKDKDKHDHFEDIDDLIEFGYELPEELKEMPWMRNIQTTIPTQVIIVGRKVLSTIESRTFIQPMNTNEKTIEIANQREQALDWHFWLMNKRSQHGLIGDIVESALRYDTVAAITVPLNWQMKGQPGLMPSRYKAAKRQGGFITLIENPKNISARYSPLGLDMVLNHKVMRARDAGLFYDLKDLLREIKGAQEELYVSVYDGWDYEDRKTWVSKPSENTELFMPGAGGHTVWNKKMELDFMPWSVFEGGSSLATGEDHKVRPLLGPIVHTKQAELMNILQSMAMSEATGYAGAPRFIITSADGETMEIAYGDINNPIIAKPAERIEQLNPPVIDQNLLLLFDRLEGAAHQLTGLRALAELDNPSGTAYATVNAQIKQATTALAPAKKLSERALSNIAEVMLRWSAHTGDDIVGYGQRDSNLGSEIRIKNDEIDPDEIYVSVSLEHHIPTDELQQINAATIMMKEMGISFIDAAKKVGISNPEEYLKRKEQELLNQTALQNEIRKMNAQTDIEIAQMQADFQASIQPPVPPEDMGGMNPESESQARLAGNGFAPTRTGAPRREAQSLAAEGQGFNPAMMGTTANELNPGGFTMEGATGVDRSGEPI